MQHFDDFDAVIVGAGFAGLYMLHRLRTLGFSAHEPILEVVRAFIADDLEATKAERD